MLHGLAAICHEAGNGGYIGSHCPKQCAPPLYSAVNSFWPPVLLCNRHPSRTNRNEKTLPTRINEEPFHPPTTHSRVRCTRYIIATRNG